MQIWPASQHGQLFVALNSRIHTEKKDPVAPLCELARFQKADSFAQRTVFQAGCCSQHEKALALLHPPDFRLFERLKALENYTNY